jgi:hypothetical protein
MKKPSLTDALAKKADPAPVVAAAPEPAGVDDNKMTTSIRIDRDKLFELKTLAHRRRCRVNDLIMQGINYVLDVSRNREGETA